MSSDIWIKAGALPQCTPVNINRCYSIFFAELDDAAIAQRMKLTRPRFSVYFFPGCSMQEEECEVAWQFEDYSEALACYLNIQSMLGVVPV